jgi:hypothetical protein
MSHWSDKYRTPENLCANCGHQRDSHLDQPTLKGDPPSSDRGWCTLPPGTCIFSPCDCKAFVEPEQAQGPSTLDEVVPPSLDRSDPPSLEELQEQASILDRYDPETK